MKTTIAAWGKTTSLVIACIVALLPLVAVVNTSLKSSDEAASGNPFALPAHPTLANYGTAFIDGKMALGFWNTTIILLVSLAGTVLTGAMAAYALDRFKFRMQKLVLGLFLIAALVPSVTTQVATFQVINKIGLFNTRGAAIALFMGTDVIAIYLFMQFMRSIPVELDEAAKLEGAGHIRIFFRIILPLLKPAIATVVIIKGIAIYNEFYIPFLYMPSADLAVVSTSLFRFQGPFGAHWEVIAAGVMLVLLPTLILFLLLQRFVYNGFTSGATK